MIKDDNVSAFLSSKITAIFIVVLQIKEPE
jgi:hypothetical protein